MPAVFPYGRMKQKHSASFRPYARAKGGAFFENMRIFSYLDIEEQKGAAKKHKLFIRNNCNQLRLQPLYSTIMLRKMKTADNMIHQSD